jgi:hypothetical protein
MSTQKKGQIPIFCVPDATLSRKCAKGTVLPLFGRGAEGAQKARKFSHKPTDFDECCQSCSENLQFLSFFVGFVPPAWPCCHLFAQLRPRESFATCSLE